MISTSKKQAPAKSLLVVDIGNRTTGIAAWTQDDVRGATSTLNEDMSQIKEDLRVCWDSMEVPGAVIVSSVAPDQLALVCEAILSVTGKQAMVVGDHLPLPMPVEIEEPAAIGTDRLCVASAAYLVERQACVVADAGSALTVDCVDDEGRFIGGSIFPGLNMLASSLHENTARLPRVTIDKPEGPLGRNTQHAIQAGILYGSAGVIRELTEQYATMLGNWPTLLLTGGDAPLLATVLDIADKVVPYLCFRGIVHSYQMHFGLCGHA